MPAYKNKKNNKWFVKYSYVDEEGKKKYITKRGFDTKREALQWEDDNRKQVLNKKDMLFEDFVDKYKLNHLIRLKPDTAKIKSSIIDNIITPFFKGFKMTEIGVNDVVEFQNTLLDEKANNGKGYSESYIRTVHSVLVALLGFACKEYGLDKNPAQIAGGVGSLQSRSDEFWTYEEYKKFIDYYRSDKETYYAFEVLYWSGMRRGELLALTPEDFDFRNDLVHINKTLNEDADEDTDNLPKTESSKRFIKLPKSLCMELSEYIEEKQKGSKQRVFDMSPSKLNRKVDIGSKATGVKRIRIHSFRHSHASLLIKLGYSPMAIASRLGHSGSYVVHRYSHMWPGSQEEIARRLDDIGK